jgi:hypothetical protein
MIEMRRQKMQISNSFSDWDLQEARARKMGAIVRKIREGSQGGPMRIAEMDRKREELSQNAFLFLTSLAAVTVAAAIVLY